MAAYFLFTLLIVVSNAGVFAQDDRTKDTEAVRSVIREVAARSGKVTALTRKLVVYSGKVLVSDQDSFVLKIRKNATRIRYDDVLELSGGRRRLSFIPELNKRGHGLWEDVNRVYAGTRIVAVLADGRAVTGFSNSATPTSLIIIERERHERLEIARDQVVAFYGLLGGFGGVKKGASKGADAMHAGRDKLLGGLLTGIGALTGLAKSDGRPILIYSN